MSFPHFLPTLGASHMSGIPTEGVGTRDAYQLAHGVAEIGITRRSSYLDDYWPCAGGRSVVNVVGT